jgi:hypothetical protein
MNAPAPELEFVDTLNVDAARKVAGAARAVREAARVPRPMPPTSRQMLLAWVRGQAVNVTRHAAALRPFRREEFGTGAAAPTEGHIQVVNDLVGRLRAGLMKMAGRVTGHARDVENLMNQGASIKPRLRQLVTSKDRAHAWVRAIEKVWDFYFELFGQRQSQYADWLLSCDRIALDCYQDAYLGCGKAKSIPAPPPFSYMRTGFSPATYRRGIPLGKLGRQLNPFPLIQLPYHRLVNPWTLGAVLHEVSHNLQSDLGLGKAIPVAVGKRLLKAGIDPDVVRTWVKWNRETFADMCGLLLGGPPFVGSLTDILSRSPRATSTFIPGAPHPTPFLRVFLSTELLRRMGFPGDADRYERGWRLCYSPPEPGAIPATVLRTFRRAMPLVVDTMCYQRFPELGDRALAEVIKFAPKELEMMEEAAGRLAAGNDPGVVPERFLIGAARIAFDRQLARPGVITRNFYKELARR